MTLPGLWHANTGVLVLPLQLPDPLVGDSHPVVLGPAQGFRQGGGGNACRVSVRSVHVSSCRFTSFSFLWVWFMSAQPSRFGSAQIM